MGEIKKRTRYGVDRYFLLVMLISFGGWAWETGLVLVTQGRFVDRGFMTLPFCPIYGTAVVGTYLLLGTPAEGRLLLKNVENRLLRYALYLLFSFLIPSLAELVVGAFFDYNFHITLWNYSTYPMNINGYVCLPISLAWAALLFSFMNFLFPPLKKLIGRIPDFTSYFLAVLLFSATFIDIALNFAAL